ncbi:hypothetical protein FXW78_29205 [Rhodococcus opacus]|nr:hypothetical protein [Rhodococcus opacus]RZL72149.1 MAG: hypothetical protein EOP32_38925 [Rhodococcus sp. (in: high G+C Gram-positive bacteria)]
MHKATPIHGVGWGQEGDDAAVPGVTRTWYTPGGPVEEELHVVVTERLRLSAVTEEFAPARARARTSPEVTSP